MKAFIVKILFVSVFFIGLGGLVEKAGLSFKSEENATQNIKIIQLEAADETIVRGVYLKDSDDCRIKIGPQLQNNLGRETERLWAEKKVD